MIADERVFTGPEKAAALLLSLGPSAAARIIKHLDQPDLRVVARAAAALGSVTPSALDRLVEEFADAFTAGVNLLGDVGQARSLLSEALPPDEIDSVIGVARGDFNSEDVWQALARVPERTLARFLGSERPADAAYVLSRLESQLAARIVSALPRGRRNAALCGLIAPHAISARAVELVEGALRTMLETSTAAEGAAPGPTLIASIINNLEPEAAEDVMRTIGETRPKDAAALKRMLFSFNDLPRLSDRARALLFDRASIDIVVMALRGTDADFRTAVLSSMPSRGRRLVEGELSSGAFAPAREIAKARKAIADIVLAMAARNEIDLAEPDDDADAA
jgi:flagellar motor switch protein FliG